MSSKEPTPDQAFNSLLRQFQDAVEAGELGTAEDIVHGIFEFSEQWCHQNPSPDLDLTISAEECENHADWAGAESAYLLVLALPDLEPATEYKARSDLAGVCRLLGRASDALSHARRATAAARRADLPILLLMALQSEARCLIGFGYIAEACDVVAEATSVVGDDRRYHQLLANNFTLQAECAIHHGALADAERDLEQASAILHRMAGMKVAAGVHQSLARMWSVTARLRDARNDRTGAINAWREAVLSSRHVASLPHADNAYTKVAVADMLKGLAEAFLADDREDDAVTAFAEREQILDEVGAPETDRA